MYNFDTIINRSVGDCEKYGRMKELFGREDAIPLWVADMDFVSGDFIIDALQKRLDHGVFGYTFRSKEYYQAPQGWLLRHSGWQVELPWLGFSPGVVTGVTYAILACTQQGDGVLIQQPVYHPFAIITRENGRQVVNNPLQWTPSGYQIDFDDFEQKIKQVKAFILCNPHNPTGRAFNEQELRRMGELCVKYGVTIIADEIHSDFVYAPHRHIHMAALNERFLKQCITFISPSKSFNLAGLFTAVTIIADEQLRKKFTTQINRLHADNSNIFGMEALKAAYTHGDEWMRQMKDYLKGNIDYVQDFLKKELPMVHSIKPEATYLMWLDFRELDLCQKDLESLLIDRCALAMNSGEMFGPTGVGFMRMNIGAPRATIEKAMRQLKAGLETLQLGKEI
ncbi:MAG: MalY/PatB family protein [Mucinivorans sp.]